MAFLIGGANSAVDAAYSVDNSCRFNDGDSAYMHITPGSAGNLDTWTFSFWMKICTFGLEQRILSTDGAAGSSYGTIMIHPTYNDLIVYSYNGTDFDHYHRTNRQFKDPSAWYHIVVAFDTTQSTAGNRVKIYVNGTLETSFRTETIPDQNQDTQFNHDTKHWLSGNQEDQNTNYFDGYLAETVFIDGLQLAPTSFGEFDEDSPTIWKPIDVSELTFGTNGFYLDFEDSGDLGDDESGNTNDFTEVNLAATDQATDTPTNNFCTINPLLQESDTTLSEGNTKHSDLNSNFKGVTGTIAVTNGKWYYETLTTTVGDGYHVGIVDVDQGAGAVAETPGGQSRGYSLTNERDVQNNGGVINNDWTGTYGDGDIVGCALDLDNNKIYWSKGGEWSAGDGTWGSTTFDAAVAAISITAGYDYVFCNSAYNGVATLNFGNPPFAISSGNADANGYGNFEYAVPSGFYALCTKNLAEFG